MMLADRWYSSGTTWAVAGVVVAVVFGVGGMWVAWRSANPRHRLVYGLASATRLLHSDRVRGNLRVLRDDTVLTDPYTVVVTLANRGRFDVPSDRFNDGEPIPLNVGAPIVEILEVVSNPDGLKPPTVRIQDSTVLVGPSKVGKGQRIRIALLVDGAKPSLTIPDNPLIDVELARAPEGTPEDRLALAAATASAASALVAVAEWATPDSEWGLVASLTLVAVVAAVLSLREMRRLR